MRRTLSGRRFPRITFVAMAHPCGIVPAAEPIAMKEYLRIVFFGILIWLIVFAVSVVILSLHASQRPLFESIMPIAIAAATVFFCALYFRRVEAGFLRAGFLLGVVWLVVNLAIDLPLFLLESPMQMSLGDYAADIGVTYLMIPVITVGIGGLLQQKVH
jgi:hypothetical protein